MAIASQRITVDDAQPRHATTKCVESCQTTCGTPRSSLASTVVEHASQQCSTTTSTRLTSPEKAPHPRTNARATWRPSGEGTSRSPSSPHTPQPNSDVASSARIVRRSACRIAAPMLARRCERAQPNGLARSVRSHGPSNTVDKLRSARPPTTPHDTHSTAERTEHHATPRRSPRFVSFIRLFDRARSLTSSSACVPVKRTNPTDGASASARRFAIHDDGQGSTYECRGFGTLVPRLFSSAKTVAGSSLRHPHA